MFESSGDPQFDANCIEAVLSVKRTDSTPLDLHGTWALLDTERRFKSKRTDAQITIFKIPIVALTLYPDRFTEQELVSDGNLQLLKNQTGSASELSQAQIDEICNHYHCWFKFFAENPHATRKDILAESLNSHGL